MLEAVRTEPETSGSAGLRRAATAALWTVDWRSRTPHGQVRQLEGELGDRETAPQGRRQQEPRRKTRVRLGDTRQEV